MQFGISYTLSKTVDDSSNWTGSSDWESGISGSRFFSIKDRGLAAFDVRQAMATNAIYQLPGSNLTGVAGHVLGGWQLSSILSLRGGNPFNAEPGVNVGNFTNMEHYPDRVGPIKYDTRNPDNYFDPSAFAFPPGYATCPPANSPPPNDYPCTSDQVRFGFPVPGAVVGNAGRSILIGPGSATLALVLQKRIRVTERMNLNFRSEFYNLLNRANFATPDGDVFTAATIQADGTRGVFNPQAGRIDSTRGTPRQLQFGLRLEF